MPQNLLFEIGTEELPSSFVARALEAMPGLLHRLLADVRLSHGRIVGYGTPRRLAVHVADLADRQPDVAERVLGPARSVAYDATGALTKAGEAFARKLGVAPAALAVVETPKGAYVAGTREEVGRPSSEVLPEVLRRFCTQIPFPKSMRWGAGDTPFGRPVQWLVALLGDAVVPLEFAGLVSGRATRGHRFLAPAPIDVPHADSWLDALRSVHVLADPEERRFRMREALLAAARDVGGELIEDSFLVEECLSLVEEPHVVTGAFDPSFLAIPEEVIVAVMRGHQRYFALRDPRGGGLLPRYLTVANTALDPVTVARGNDRVLRARLADAQFFVREDARTRLAERALKLSGVVFQSALGTVAEKVERLRALAETLAPADLRAATSEAASLAKADLVSLIVGEFPELQGVMGRYYALAEGIDRRVADAIRDHYAPRSATDRVPNDVVGAAVAIADRADTLVGCFGIGLIPSGSADPFALRRAALGLVRIALEGPLDVDVRATLAAAYAGYASQGKPLAPEAETLRHLIDFVKARLRALYGERYPADLVDAVLAAWEGGSLRDLDARMRAVAELRSLPQWSSLAVAFKRAYNIAKDAPPGDFDPALLEEEAEQALGAAIAAHGPAITKAIEQRDYAEALATVARELRAPIDTFFERVFVMVDRADLRANRLRLLAAIARPMTRVAHFHLITAGS
jgi:glycyl-tRNA synthetase beta chain